MATRAVLMRPTASRARICQLVAKDLAGMPMNEIALVPVA
jgi:hypothetical protein